jgi:hypothetical protein
LLEQANAKGNHGNGNKSPYKPIEDVNQKIYLVDLGLGFFIDQSQNKFKNKQKRDNGIDQGNNTIIGREGRIIA